MTTTMRRDVWNTYATTGYTNDVGNDQRSAGGVHHHEVRRRRGGWQARIRQSNGRYTSFGPIQSLSDESGEDAWARAKWMQAQMYAV